MTVFPQVSRVIIVELFVNNAWVNISSDVYTRNNGNLTIIRGGQDEQSRPGPQSCVMTIDCRSGNYSPRNPVGIYYGSIGRNTPIRVAVELASDTYTRIVANGWGSTDTGQAWTVSGSPVNSAADFSVGSGTAKHITPAVPAGKARRSTLPGLYQDVDISVTATLSFTGVTGGAVEFGGLSLRDQGASGSYYLVTPSVAPGTLAISLVLRRYDAGVATTLATYATGLTHNLSQSLTVRGQIESNTLRGKVWVVGTSEPFVFQTEVNDATYITAGLVGIQSTVTSANTNSGTVTFTYDNLSVRSMRFFGEVATWPQQWDITGRDAFATITASGIKRRLGQSAAPMRSALYRYHSQLATQPPAYWPCEDLPAAQTFASAVGGPALIPSFGTTGTLPAVLNDAWVTFANYAAYPGSTPIATLPAIGTLAGANIAPLLTGTVSPYALGSGTYFRFLFTMPLSTTATVEPVGGSTIVQLLGASSTWFVSYQTGGLISLGNSAGFSSGAVSFGGDIRGRDLLYSLSLVDSGGNVNYDLTVLEVGASSGLHISGGRPGISFFGLLQVGINENEWLFDCKLGHFVLRTDGVVGVADIIAPLNSWSGETAGARMRRLCTEEGVTFYYVGDLTMTSVVGPQGSGAITSGVATTNSRVAPSTSQTFLDALNEAEDVDLGILYEPRGALGLEYRTRSDLYTQNPALTLDYSLGQVGLPLLPVDDDQKTRNNIIVTRINGLSAEAELTTGRLSTLAPSAGGVGQYNAQFNVNVAADSQLADLATFLLALYTVDESRYPTITVNLANPDTVTAGLELAALGVNVGDLIAINNPRVAYAPDQIRQIVRGYTEVLAQYIHTLTFNCSPESPYRFARLDTSPAMRIDTSTSTLSTSYSSSATALVVNNVNEPWSTDPADMPSPISVAGEQMSLTAVSGSTSPQTFTVVRSTNGVVKAQASGASVRPSVPLKLGY